MAHGTDQRALGLTLALGLAGVVLKLVYSFFPMFNILDAIVFFTLGWFAWRIARPPMVLGTLLLSLPALALTAYFLFRLGSDAPTEGVGTGWMISAFLVPIAAAAGLYFGRRNVVASTG